MAAQCTRGEMHSSCSLIDPHSPMTFLSHRLLMPLCASLCALLLVLSGCDSSGSSTEPLEVTADEAAEDIALALATDPGGTLDDVEDAASVASVLTRTASMRTASPSVAHARHLSPTTCSFNNSAVLWTCGFDVTRSGERGTVTVARTYEVQFLDAEGTPLPFYEVGATTASTLSFDVTSGSGTVTTERVDNNYTINTSQWTLSDITDAEATLNGTVRRTMNGTLTGENATRTRTATVSSTARDLVWIREEGPSSGSLSGSYSAEVTITRDGESATRTVEAAYTVMFTDGQAELTFTGEGSRFNGASFRFDVESGDLLPAS